MPSDLAQRSGSAIGLRVRPGGPEPAYPLEQFLIRPEQASVALAGVAGVLAHQPGTQRGRGGIVGRGTWRSWHFGHDGSAEGVPPRPLLAKGEPAPSD
jgi:hypothetical protein